MKAARIPGLALAIVQDGRAVHVWGFGRADDGGWAFTPQTPFFIGSNSKSFTALAVMQLAEAGVVELDAPVLWGSNRRSWRRPVSSLHCRAVRRRSGIHA
jgi:CubicO group peptidase (beta-lactamase class C family)